MSRLAVPLAVLAVMVGCGGGDKVRTADDARSAVRQVLDGTDSSDFELADDASAAARAIYDDLSEVNSFETTLATAGKKGCDAAGIASDLGEKGEDGISISAEIRAEIVRRWQEAHPQAPPSDVPVFVLTVVDAMVGLTEAAATEVIATSCDVAEML